MGAVAIDMAIALVACLLLAGCSFYNHAYPTTGSAVSGRDDYELGIVQVDDFGSFWDPKGAQELVRSIEEQASHQNILVTVFVHGWHHNADPNDDNLISFKESLSQLSAMLSAPNREVAREQMTGTRNVKVVGVYIGWRGRSLPSFLDYGTMWWRKDAAERAGDGDVAEFLQRLQRIYLRTNAYKRYLQAPGDTSFMGLVTIGHSFGGQVVLKSVSHELELALTERAPALTDAVRPPTSPSRQQAELVAIDSFGDLNILLNPALEAYQYNRIDGLYRQMLYPSTQTPQLVVFSADNDVPRTTFFPLARALTRPFRPSFRTSYQGTLYGKALGEVPSQQTHRLDLVSNAADVLTDTDYTIDRRQRIADFDFTGDTIFAGIKMQPIIDAPRVANSPVAVVVTHDKIIDGHNGIFKSGFKQFLASYIAFVEGKRLVLRYQRYEAQRLTAVKNVAPPAPESVAASFAVSN